MFNKILKTLLCVATLFILFAMAAYADTPVKDFFKYNYSTGYVNSMTGLQRWYFGLNSTSSVNLCLNGSCISNWTSAGSLTGTGTANYIPYWKNSTTLSSTAIFYDATNSIVMFGTNTAGGVNSNVFMVSDGGRIPLSIQNVAGGSSNLQVWANIDDTKEAYVHDDASIYGNENSTFGDLNNNKSWTFDTFTDGLGSLQPHITVNGGRGYFDSLGIRDNLLFGVSDMSSYSAFKFQGTSMDINSQVPVQVGDIPATNYWSMGTYTTAPVGNVPYLQPVSAVGNLGAIAGGLFLVNNGVVPVGVYFGSNADAFATYDEIVWTEASRAIEVNAGLNFKVNGTTTIAGNDGIYALTTPIMEVQNERTGIFGDYAHQIGEGPSIGFRNNRCSSKLGAVCTGAQNYDGVIIGSAMEADGRTLTTTYGSGLAIYTNKDGSITEKLRVTQDGNVGIGVTTTSYKLEVNGNANASNFVVDSGGDILPTTDATDAISIKSADGTSRTVMRIDTLTSNSVGRIALGLDTAPQYQLEVINQRLAAAGGTDRGITISQHVSAIAAAQMNWKRSRGTYATPTIVAVNDVLGNIQGLAYDGNEYLGVVAYYGQLITSAADNDVQVAQIWGANPAGAASLTGEKMRLTYDGKLGIGTTTPLNQLEVSGTARFTGTSTASCFTTDGSTCLTSGTVYTAGSNIDITAGVISVTTSPSFASTTLSGSLFIPTTVTSTGVGIIYMNSIPYIHSPKAVSNFFAGYNAGNLTLSSANAGNTGIGNQSLMGLTTGYYNMAMGWNSLAANTEGYSNVAIGAAVLTSSITGDNNVAIGQSSLQNSANDFNRNIAVGALSLNNVNFDGDDNIVVGYGGGYKMTTANENTILGASAGYNMTTGDNNTAVGRWSCGGLTTGSSNICLGYYSGYDMTNNVTNTILIGNNVSTSMSNVGVLGTTTAPFYWGIGTSTPYSTLSLVGSLSYSPCLYTTSSTLDATCYSVYVSSSATVNITLPDPSTITGRRYEIKNIGTTAFNIITTATLDGNTTTSVSVMGAPTVEAYNSKWYLK